jgi:hypothetical protein
MSEEMNQHNFVDGRCTKCGQTPPEFGYSEMDRIFGRSVTCPTPEQQEELGDDWDFDKMTPMEMLVQLNDALLAKLEQQGFIATRKITVTLPIRVFEDLRRKFIGVPGTRAEISVWTWMHENNSMAANGVPFEILPRYSFKDVKGMVAGLETSIQGNYVALTDAPVDPYCVIHPNPETVKHHDCRSMIDPKLYTESWIGKKAQESGDKLKDEIKAMGITRQPGATSEVIWNPKRYEFELDNGAVEDPDGYYMSYAYHVEAMAEKDAEIAQLRDMFLFLGSQGKQDLAGDMRYEFVLSKYHTSFENAIRAWKQSAELKEAK